MRRLIAIPCAGETLVASLDLPDAPPTCGLLIVSGGNEVRAGAHRGMAMLAARLAEDGVAVLRYDRRGVGDSSGENEGWSGARADLAAALGILREAGATRIAGFGNCDAATLLALEGQALGLDALVLANPWTMAEEDALPPAAAIRDTYAKKLRRPSEWWRLLRGGVNLRKLAAGLWKLWRTPKTPPPFAKQVTDAIARWSDRATVVLAEDDATAIAYADAAGRAGSAVGTITIPTASHGFARVADKLALENAIRWAMRRM